jgi:hypothetical protein
VIITTGRIRRTLINKINLLVDLPRSVEASRLALVKAESIFLRRVSGCFGTSRGSSSTTSTTSRVWVPRHVARLVTRLVVPLVVDYFASRRLVVDYSGSRRLVVDYFTSAARPGASARRAARHVAHRLSSTTSPTLRDRVPRHVARLVAPLVVDYFAYAARPGASARRATRHAAHRRLLRAPRLRLAATLALLQPHRAS